MSFDRPLSSAQRWIWDNIVFGGITLVLVAFAYTPLASPLNEPLCAVSYAGTERLLDLFGVAYTADPARHVISGRVFSLEVAGLCSGLRALALFAAVLIQIRLPWKRAALDGALGATVLVALNAARIAHLYQLGEARSPSFTLYHEWIWPSALVSLILLYRYLMMRAASRAAAAVSGRTLEVAHG